MTDLVSVVIPSHNHGRFISETLASVRVQDYQNWECVIVDNGSTDDSVSTIRNFVAGDKRFTLICQENKGVSNARNTAIRASRGKYILPLDSDDRIGPAYVRSAAGILAHHPEVMIVYSHAELFGDASGPWKLPAFSIQRMLRENVIFSSAMFRRSDFDAAGGYDEEMKTGFEDWDFWLLLLNSGGKVVKLPDIHFFYRIRKHSRNSSLSSDTQLELRRKIFNKHRELYERHLDIPLMLFESYQFEKQLMSCTDSAEYRAGSSLLKPFRFFRSLIRK